MSMSSFSSLIEDGNKIVNEFIKIFFFTIWVFQTLIFGFLFNFEKILAVGTANIF